MSYPLFDLRGTVFVPLSEAKAKLSEFMRRIAAGRERLAVTTNGRPTAVILSYNDYLALLKMLPVVKTSGEEKVIQFDEWKKGAERRKNVSASIRNLFDMSRLTRKGKKRYKQEGLKSLDPEGFKR